MDRSCGILLKAVDFARLTQFQRVACTRKHTLSPQAPEAQLDRWFERLTEQITLAHDEESVKTTLQKLTSKAGFNAYAYLNMQPETQTALSNYAEEWQERYFDKGYVRVDPVVRTARTTAEAFVWSNISSPKTSKERRNFYGEAAEFGIRSGISIPIRTGFGRMAMLTLASSEAQFAEGWAFNPVLAAASFGQIHARMEGLRIRPTRKTNIRMKADELTCLRWSAEGKSMKDIAAIENTTYSNVAFFIRNAKAALGVWTLPQATALAKELGLI